MLNSVKDFLFPKICFCGAPLTEESSLCAECWGKMDFVSSSVCNKCGFPQEYDFGNDSLCPSCIQKSPEFTKARFAFKYNEFSGKLITSYKYGDKTHLSELFSKILLNLIKKEVDHEDFDLVTSVPISYKRLLVRKFNQSSILANKIGKKINTPVNNCLLLRNKHVPPQTSLKRKHRLKNVRGIFDINKKFLKEVEGKKIIIIDDVYTTGATLNECSKALLKAGAEEVFAITLARTFLE